MHASVFRFSPSDDPKGDSKGGSSPRDMLALGRDDLPYKVEIWDETKSSVEQTLAVTASSSIGYAAYYAATREYPDRFITLRHKSHVISRWNGPPH